MEWLLFHLDQITTTDTPTLAILALIAGACVSVVRNSLVVPALVVLMFPMIVAIGAVINYILKSFEIFLQSKVDQWAMQVISAGTIAAIIVVGLVALLGKAKDYRKTA
ncbi:MAG TPA: hypothetical protein PK970_05020 [Hyphomicrobiaceae bacterium]|nr:hypothetical protein [Hyphomicrobiaceae bacterium]